MARWLVEPSDLLPRDLRDEVAEQLLAACEADPRDEGARAMLADRLDDLGPTRRRATQEVPNWMRNAWIASRVCQPAYLRSFERSKAAIFAEVQQWIDHRNPSLRLWMDEYRRPCNVLDHAGECVLFGRRCFLTEPYDYGRENVADFSPFRHRLLHELKRLCQVVGGTPVVSGVAAHALGIPDVHEWLLRGLIIPEPGRK